MSDPMDDFFDEPEVVKQTASPQKRKRRPGCFLNLLSGIFVAGTMVVGLLFGIIFINPQTGLNPLPPTTLPALVLTNTPTPTPKGILPPTWTPTVIPTQTSTPTPTPTETPIPTAESSPIPTADLESGVSFGIQEGFPAYEINTVHADAGCNWLGVAGQIIDKDGLPVSGVLVETGGTLGSQEISGITLSGMAPAYGEGGFELHLSSSPAASDDTIWIQLLDQANLPLSEKIFFDTYESCDSNLIKVNFIQLAIQ